MSNEPAISNDPMYQLLREGKIDEFNAKKQAGDYCNLQSCDFRSLDLKGIDAVGLDFRNAYFRMTDMRGIDFRGSLLDGASINGAKISGAYFPVEIPAQEILLALTKYLRQLVCPNQHHSLKGINSCLTILFEGFYNQKMLKKQEGLLFFFA